MKTRAPRNEAQPRRSPTPRGEGGFTLVEVMIAMAIIAMTAVVLLDQRLEVVRDAARARDLRTSWVLASQKLAELELDKTLWTGVGSQSNGDFSDVDSEVANFLWEYQIVRLPIDITDPKDLKSDKKPRELLRLTLGVRAPGIEDPLVLEAEFPIRDPASPPAASGDGKDPAAGSRPPVSGETPGTGGKK